MSIRKIPGTSLSYYLIPYDENGQESADSDGIPPSKKLLDDIRNEAFSDIFVMSHGWLSDLPGAIAHYDPWVRNLMTATADIASLASARAGFSPLLVCLHWPSEPFGDENVTSFSMPVAGDLVQALVNDYARRIGDTPEIRAELTTIAHAHVTIDDPQSIPAEVEAAYRGLDQELGLGHAGEGAAPGDDLPSFDPEDIFQAARQQAAQGSFGLFSIDDLLVPLRVLSFWKMKDRAQGFGASAANKLFQDMHVAAGSGVPIHVMGHSFGCIVVSAMVAGAAGSPKTPVQSMVLVQGALSLWAYCSDIPVHKGIPGFFNRLIQEGRVTGPIVTTQSEFDTAIGVLYPLAAGLRNQVAFGEFPTFGGVGAFGIQGMNDLATGLKMAGVSEDYAFEPGKIYNFESSKFIKTGGAPMGAHSDIVHPEIAHVIWQATKA